MEARRNEQLTKLQALQKQLDEAKLILEKIDETKLQIDILLGDRGGRSIGSDANTSVVHSEDQVPLVIPRIKEYHLDLPRVGSKNGRIKKMKKKKKKKKKIVRKGRLMKKIHIWTIPGKKWVINTKKKMNHKYRILQRIEHMNKYSGSRSVKVKNKDHLMKQEYFDFMHDGTYAVSDEYF